MSTIHVTIPEELYKRMFKQIQNLAEGSTYGKAKAFTILALEKLVEALENGNVQLREELKSRFEKIRKE